MIILARERNWSSPNSSIESILGNQRKPFSIEPYMTRDRAITLVSEAESRKAKYENQKYENQKYENQKYENQKSQKLIKNILDEKKEFLEEISRATKNQTIEHLTEFEKKYYINQIDILSNHLSNHVSSTNYLTSLIILLFVILLLINICLYLL